MKKILILLILNISVLNLYSQNSEPSALPFNWGEFEEQPFNPNVGQFKQEKFLTGFQWSGSQKFNKLMKNNANAGGTGFAEGLYGRHDLYTESIKGIKQPSGNPLRICRAMVYEPTLIVTNPDILNTRPNDITNAIWGFTSMSLGEITNNTSDPNYNRLVLRNKPYYSTGTTILNGLSEQPNFFTNKEGAQKAGYFGHRWYVSINLRKIANTTLANNTTFLSIKLKYKTVISADGALSESQEIKFDSVPNPLLSEELLNNRGKQQKLNAVQTPPPAFWPYDWAQRTFYITPNMIPNLNEDKTISASFLTITPTAGSKYEYLDYFVNPPFLKDVRNRKEVGRIAEMDIEVKYYGGVDIAIDYIKIENENGYYLSRGYADDLPDDGYLEIIGNYNYTQLPGSTDVPKIPAAAMNGIKQTIQASLDTLKKYPDRCQPNGLQMDDMFRVFIEDTESDNPNTWFQLRYANLVTNGVAITRDNPYKSDAYYYYTKAPNRYLGMKLCENQRTLPAPWVFTTNSALESQVEPWKRMNLKWGNRNSVCRFWGTDQQATVPLNSGFETDLIISVDPSLYGVPARTTGIESVLATDINNLNHLKYLDEVETTSGFHQIRYEWYNRRIFYKEQGFLYSEKPWFMNFFLTNEFSYDWGEAPVSYFSGHRPHTGEETRLLISGVLLKGAKGLFYDRESRYFHDPRNEFPKKKNPFNPDQPTEFQLGMASTLEPDILPAEWTYNYTNLMNKKLGDDYIFSGSYPKAISKHFEDNAVRTQIVNALGIGRDSIYLGMRSTRLEVYKIHSWIRRLEENNNPDNLMNLRLVAWKGKGFKTWYNQDPATSTPDVMNTYIKKDQIRTAKLYQPNALKREYDNNNIGMLISANNFKNVNDENLSVNTWESPDSAFYDITILRHTDLPIGNTSKCYIGVQNRRTDPLIYELRYNNIFQAYVGDLKFYSTAEFEDLCNSTDVNIRTKYRDYYWMRLGCRLIEIPLSNSYASTPFAPFSVRIKELLADDNTFNGDNATWRSSAFCHLPNIYIAGSVNYSRPNPIIRVRMLPGEGKLLKVEKIIIPIFNFANNRTLTNEETPLNMELAMSRNDSLVYNVVFENNTENKAEQLGIILFDEVGEPISIQPTERIQVADYMEENIIIPNSKVIIIYDLKPKSKTVIGQVSCSKKNPSKFTYFLDVVNEKNERGSYKMAASMNNIHKKSAEDIESIDNKVSNISIAPNPAKERAELSFTATEQGNADITVVDILGNQLLRISDYIAYPGANSLNINLSNFSGGVYNVIVKTISGVSTQKFSVVK